VVLLHRVVFILPIIFLGVGIFAVQGLDATSCGALHYTASLQITET
jgi:hypothetical protein